MNIISKLSLSTSLLILAIIVTGCGGGGGGGGPAPLPPPDPGLIDASNAFSRVQYAGLASDAVFKTTESNTSGTDCSPTGNSSIAAGTDTITAQDISLVFPFFSADIIEQYSSLVTFTSCGVTVAAIADTYYIDGEINFSYLLVRDPGGTDYIGERASSSTINLATTDPATPTDDVTLGNFVVSRYTHASDSALTGQYRIIGKFSYASSELGSTFQIGIDITGTVNVFFGIIIGYNCPTGGTIVVDGAEGTQARSTFSYDSSVAIEYHTGDGVWQSDNLAHVCEDFEI